MTDKAGIIIDTMINIIGIRPFYFAALHNRSSTIAGKQCITLFYKIVLDKRRLL